MDKLYIEDFLDPEISLSAIELENQNELYYGSRFYLNKYSVRFRKAKVTPTKSGLFVVVWEKDANNENKAYSHDTAPDYMMVYCEEGSKKGVFLFQKDTLLKNKILSSSNIKGKMGFRVYPPWVKTESSQALKTQKWQCDFFIDLNGNDAKDLLKDYFIE